MGDYTGSEGAVGASNQSCHPATDPDNSAPKDAQKKEEKIHKKFRFSLFFDGTFNNMTNANQRPESDGSYANDITNVVFLFQNVLTDSGASPDYDSHTPFYVEGIGTTDNEDDSTFGAATGAGDTGVLAKVNRGLTRVVKSIVDIIGSSVEDKEKTIIDKIHLDSFGFSRGAAAARSFIYKALTDADDNIKKQLPGYTISEIKVRFVGLFDTVASYKGTSSLHLDAISDGNVEHIVQLAAADEHRSNFPLTNIKSAGGKGIEIFLPGVHSDIGGGYPDNQTENFQMTSGNPLYLSQATINDITSLINSGWVYKTDVKNKSSSSDADYLTDKQDIKDGFDRTNNLYVTRKGAGDGLCNKYRRIPMHVMKSKATSLGVLKFNPQINTGEDTSVMEGMVPLDVIEANTLIQAYVAKGSSSAHDWNMSSPLLNKLRHDYLHFSSSYTLLGINDPRFSNGTRTREIING